MLTTPPSSANSLPLAAPYTPPWVVRTSNPKKRAEFERFGFGVRVEPGVDLPEVDGTPDEVVTYKALDAGPGILVEDTSLDVDGMDVGVNIRWAIDAVRSRLASYPSRACPAVWRVYVAYHDGATLYRAKGEIFGTMLAEPRGTSFAFDAHFVPNGETRTLGELEALGLKDRWSARKAALKNMLEGIHEACSVASVPTWTGAYQEDGTPASSPPVRSSSGGRRP